MRGKHILFSASQQALFALNDSAAEIWRALEEGARVEAILNAMVARGIERNMAAAYFEAVLRDWERLGLVEPVRPSCPIATPDYLSQFVDVAGLRARILYPRALAFPAMTVFRHLEAAPAASDVTLQLDEQGERIHLFRDGAWAASCGPDEIPVMVKGQLVAGILERGSYELALHAAALLHRGRGLLLCGNPGAGKTTLGLALVHAGFGFLADDVTLLDAGGRAVGVACAPAVKAGSWPVLAGYFPALEGTQVFRRPDRKRVRFLVPEGYAPAGPQRIGWVVLLRRRRGAEPALRAIEPADVLRGLLNGAFARERELSSSGFDVLCQVIRSARGFCLTYAGLEDAVGLLRAACR